MRSTFSVDGAADDAEDLVALVEQELGQVRAVLARDARDQRAPRLAHPASCRPGRRVARCERVGQRLLERDLRLPAGGGGSLDGSPQTTGTSAGRIRAGSGSTVTGARAERRSAGRRPPRAATVRPARDVVVPARHGRVEQRAVGATDVADVARGRARASRSPTRSTPPPARSSSASCRVQEPIAKRSSRPGPSCWKARATTTSSPPRAGLARGDLGGGLRGGVRRQRRAARGLRRRARRPARPYTSPVETTRSRARRRRLAGRLEQVDGADGVDTARRGRIAPRVGDLGKRREVDPTARGRSSCTAARGAGPGR